MMDLVSLHGVLLDVYHFRVQCNVAIIALKNFQLNVSVMSLIERVQFAEENHRILADILFDINTLTQRKLSMQYHIALSDIRSVIYGSLLPTVNYKINKESITAKFSEFIKGITTFHTQNKKDSCNCIRKSYLTQLVYDNIWTRIMKRSQDLSAIQWLEQTKRAYDDAFPESHMSIDITYDKYDVPLSLQIYEKNGVYESYDKRYDTDKMIYLKYIYCMRSNNSGLQRRLNSYDDGEGVWCLLS